MITRGRRARRRKWTNKWAIEGSEVDALDDELWGDGNKEEEEKDLKEEESKGKQKQTETNMVAKDENSHVMCAKS